MHWLDFIISFPHPYILVRVAIVVIGMSIFLLKRYKRRVKVKPPEYEYFRRAFRLFVVLVCLLSPIGTLFYEQKTLMTPLANYGKALVTLAMCHALDLLWWCVFTEMAENIVRGIRKAICTTRATPTNKEM